MPPRKVGAKKAARRAKRRVKLARDPLDPTVENCRRGMHPVGRRIGRGCGACGKPDAW